MLKRYHLWLYLLWPLLFLSSCQVGRFVLYNFADAKDYRKFPNRPLQKAAQPFQFAQAPKKLRFDPFTKVERPGDTTRMPMEDFLAQQGTLALLVIRRDTVLYERYWHPDSAATIVPSFSVAKSFTSALIGCAIADGLIRSEDQPITDFLPELDDEFKQVSLRHVLQMTSGLRFNEGYYNPFGHVAAFYYGRRLRQKTAKLRLKQPPGQDFDYVSGNTQLLGAVLDRVLAPQGKTVTMYLQEKLWGPLGMEYDASWSIDRRQNGIEKTFCCLNARARDFAKFGRLYLKEGNWQGRQLVPVEWVRKSVAIDTTQGSSDIYQYQWWINQPGKGYQAIGILGQYIYVLPEKEVIIVRLGSKQGAVHWPGWCYQLASQL